GDYKVTGVQTCALPISRGRGCSCQSFSCAHSHAIALVLALAKRISQSVRYQIKREWAQEKLWHEHPRPREVAGGAVAVVGMGGIGREFAIRAKALGMRVLAVRENPAKGTEGADAVYGPGQLDEVLPQAD